MVVSILLKFIILFIDISYYNYFFRLIKILFNFLHVVFTKSYFLKFMLNITALYFSLKHV